MPMSDCHSDQRLAYGAAMPDRTSDEADVREVVRQFDDALERLDLEAALSLSTEDLVFIGSGQGEQAVGRDAVLRMAEELASRSADIDFTITTSTMDVNVYGDVAVVTSFGIAELRSPRGSRTGPYRLTGTLLRDRGNWKWRVHHGSEPLPW
jgi:uncharacterized protein (TIGR02246 family)